MSSRRALLQNKEGPKVIRSRISRFLDYFLRTGAPGVLGALVSLFAFGANVVLVVGSTVGRILAAGSVALVTAAALLIILARGIEASRQVRKAEDRIQLYCQEITDRSPEPFWRVISWEDKVSVLRNGDTTEEVTVKVVVTSPEFQFIRITNGSGWSQPERVRRLVKVETSSIATDEVTGGASWFITKSWKKNGKLEVLGHCRTSIAVNSVVTLSLFYSWPEKCSPLMKGEEDLFKLSFKGGLENLDYSVTLPNGPEVEWTPVEGPGSADGQISVEVNQAKNIQRVRLQARDIEPGMAIGMSLKLKGGGPWKRPPPFWRRR